MREVNKKNRVNWCKERKNWTVEDQWKKWIFSDESQVVIGENNRIYVWRKDDEKDQPHLVCPAPRRRLSLMILGCVCYDGVGTLTCVEGNINAAKYIDIVDNNLWPVIAAHFTDKPYVYMDDNASVHRANAVKVFMENNEINTTTWPAQSPDLNIIENLWLKIKRSLQRRATFIHTRQDLLAEIRRIWESVTVEYIRELYSTIPTRILEVIRMKGNLTKY